MHTKYTNALKDNTAIMMLYGEIGGPVSAEYFTEEMSWHHSNGRKIKVYINTPGGLVFGGYSIIQAIIDYKADTHIVGLAASMGGIISQFGKRRTANDFATGMIHMPSTDNEGENTLLEIVAKQLKDILLGRSKIKEGEIDAMMAKDTYFDASEMLNYGLIDEIISTTVAPVKLNNVSVGDLYNIYNSLIKKDEMKKIKDHFKLGEDATEDQILNSISTFETDINDKLADAEQKIADGQEKITNLEAEKATLVEEIAANIVDAAIEIGKISKDKKDIWIDAAKKDPKAVKAQLESVNQNSSVQNLFKKKDDESSPEKDVVKFFHDGGKELEKIKNEDPDRFLDLMNQYELETSKIKK